MNNPVSFIFFYNSKRFPSVTSYTSDDAEFQLGKSLEKRASTEKTGECFHLLDNQQNEKALIYLAQDIPDSNIYKMGNSLGFAIADIDRFHAMNHSGNTISTLGTLRILRAWYEKTPPGERDQELRTALEEASLHRLVEKYFVARRCSRSDHSARESMGS